MKDLRKGLLCMVVYYITKTWYTSPLLWFGICGLNEKLSGAVNLYFSPIFVEPG